MVLQRNEMVRGSAISFPPMIPVGRGAHRMGRPSLAQPPDVLAPGIGRGPCPDCDGPELFLPPPPTLGLQSILRLQSIEHGAQFRFQYPTDLWRGSYLACKCIIEGLTFRLAQRIQLRGRKQLELS